MNITKKLLLFSKSLIEDERITLTAHLIGEIEQSARGIDSRIFHAILLKFPSVPIELVVLDQENRVLMFYRKDHEYDGFHMPGTVLRNNETVPQAVDRLLQSEVVGAGIISVENVGVTEISRGTKCGENPTRHEISILYLARLGRSYAGNGGIFSPMDDLPENTLPHHRVLVEKFQKYIKTGKPILVGD